MRASLAAEGLIAEAGTDKSGNPIYTPRWLVRTKGVRKATLALGQTITVEMRFRTSVGASRDTVLREPLRSEKGLAGEVERHRRVDAVDAQAGDEGRRLPGVVCGRGRNPTLSRGRAFRSRWVQHGDHPNGLRQHECWV
jgi:hypothetical protein